MTFQEQERAVTLKTRQHGLPIPDKRGRIRPTVGKTPDGTKAKVQVGNVNSDGNSEMMRRLTLIRCLYDRQCERGQIDFWNHWTFRVAKRIGSGQAVTEEFLSGMFEPDTLAGAVAQLQQWGIPVVAGKVFEQGVQLNREQIERMVAVAVQEKVAQLQSVRGPIVDHSSSFDDPMSLAETATFHEALEDYRKHFRKTAKKNDEGKLTQGGESKLKEIGRLKERLEDFPLRELNVPKWEAILATWKNRPQTKRGTRGSVEWCSDVIKILVKFVKWIDTNPTYRWSLPKGFLDMDRSIVSLPEDESPEIFQTINKKTYDPEQLAVIMSNANAEWKVMIAFCVNCAFGQSEVGQWATKRIVFGRSHPHAEKISWRSDASDNWACGPRPKTGCYGEHLLWPEVASSLHRLLEDGRPVVPMTRTGRPMWMKYAKRPQSQFDNRWRSLLDKVQSEHPDFERLPFGSLRDILPNVLRRDFSDDIASLALQHGTYSADKLLKCYANFPFAKLFEATEKLHDYFMPMLKKLSIHE